MLWNSAGSYSKTYTVELSTDNATFVSAYSQAAGTGGTSLTETVTLATPGVARWVRLSSTKRSATYGISLKEFYVKGANLSASCGPGCTVTGDCAAGQTCNTTTGACSSATGCTTNSDYTGGKLCAGTGQCVTMASSFDPILSNAHTKSFKRGFMGNLCGPGGTKYGQRDLDLVGDCKIDYNAVHSYASNYASNYVLGSIANWQTSNLTAGETAAEAARLTALSTKPYWITEFGGWYAYQEDNAVRWANLDLDAYETSPLVFRYALFKTHTEPGDIYALSYMSLLAGLYTSGNSAVCAPNVWGRTWVGACYLTHPIGIANASAGTPSPYCVANAAAGLQNLPATCPAGATKVPRIDNPPLTQAEIKAVSTMPPSPALPAGFGPSTCSTCLPL